MPSPPETDLRTAVAVGTAVRLALIAVIWLGGHADATLTLDSPSYLAPAASLARGAGFLDARGAPELMRTPGYPALLAPGMWLGAPVAWALLAQVVLSALLIQQVGRLALDSGLPARGARIAAWLCACDPWLVVMTTQVMSEVACVLALTVGLRHAARAMRDDAPSTTHAWRAGAWLAVATFVRPISAAAWVVVSLAFALAGPRRQRRWRLVACAVAFVALVAPWHLRNGWLTGYWGFSTMSTRVVYLTLGGTAQAAAERRPFQDVRRERLSSGKSLTPGEMTRQGLATLVSAPRAVLLAHAAGMVRVVGDPGGIEWLRSVGRYPRAGGLLGTIQEQGLLAGLAELARRHPTALAALIATASGLLVWPLALAGWPALPSAVRATWVGVILALVVLSGGVHANGRFRVPFVPLLDVMAAAGLLRIGSRYTSRHA